MDKYDNLYYFNGVMNITVSFINLWLLDKNKLCYEKIIFEPNILLNKNNENYNLFNGYEHMTYSTNIIDEKESYFF